MMVLRRVWAAALASALLAVPLAATGCSGGSGEPKVANVQSGEMPKDAAWKGVYYSELYGYLHIVQEGNKLKGKWQRPSKDRWGELKGEVTGDVARFEWKEYVTGLVGPNSKKEGRGYFKYQRPPGDNVDDKIVGEIGRDKDEVGEPWDAIKQRRMEPDLASIGGTGSGDLGGGDWDGDNKQQGNPESPKPPSPP